MRLAIASFGLVAVLVASGCGGDDSSSPVAPSAPIPDFAGTWTGELKLTSSRFTDGFRELDPDIQDCDTACGSIPVSADFTQSGRGVSGSITTTFGSPPEWTWDIQTGTVDGTGTLRLTLQAAQVMQLGLNLTYNLTGWESRIDGTVMTGTGTVEMTAEGVTGAGTHEFCLGVDPDSNIADCSNGLQRP